MLGHEASSTLHGRLQLLHAYACTFNCHSPNEESSKKVFTCVAARPAGMVCLQGTNAVNALRLLHWHSSNSANPVQLA
jgi:hypothetical protein